MPDEDFLRPAPAQPPVPPPATSTLDILAGAQGPSNRPFLQVYFVCSNAYQRVYRSADQKRYLARCPKCGREMNFQVGPGGTDQRVFKVSCA